MSFEKNLLMKNRNSDFNLAPKKKSIFKPKNTKSSEAKEEKVEEEEEEEKCNLFVKKKSSLFERRQQKFSLTVPEKSEFSMNFLEKISKDSPTVSEIKKERDYSYFVTNHPLVWETNGVNIFLKKFKETINPNCNFLLSGLSSANLAFMVRKEKKLNDKLNIFCDTSTPFLYFFSENIKRGKTKYKNSPPIREKQNLSLILKTLKVNAFDTLSSNHLQVPLSLKNIDQGNFRRAFNGISSLGSNLQIAWTKLYLIEKNKNIRYQSSNNIYNNKRNSYSNFSNNSINSKNYNYINKVSNFNSNNNINHEESIKIKNKYDFEQQIKKIMKLLILLFCFNPAKITNLIKNKGTIEIGKDADIVIWDPFKVFKFTNKTVGLKYPENYVLLNKDLYGLVSHTILRGNIVFDYEKNLFKKSGKILIQQ